MSIQGRQSYPQNFLDQDTSRLGLRVSLEYCRSRFLKQTLRFSNLYQASCGTFPFLIEEKLQSLVGFQMLCERSMSLSQPKDLVDW